MLYALICNGMNKSKWYEIERWNEIKGENISWSPPIGPTAYWALASAPWSGAPNPNRLVGPCRTTHIKIGGDHGLSHEVGLGRHDPTDRNPNLIYSVLPATECPTTPLSPLQGLHRSNGSPPRLLTTVPSTGVREATSRANLASTLLQPNYAKTRRLIRIYGYTERYTTILTQTTAANAAHIYTFIIWAFFSGAGSFIWHRSTIRT